ncbi:hypothetical protein HVC08_002386 [Salmonella enterica]|nr:hypothetical protein [Salmonella enterica]
MLTTITFAQIAVQGRSVDIGTVTGNMDEKHDMFSEACIVE